MQTIPIRQLKETDLDFAQSFRIRDVRDLLAGKDMVQELHRHNFYFVLALKNGHGKHEIDFTPYKVENRCIFIIRPGQVHQLTLKAGSAGYLLTFNAGFYHRDERGSNQALRRASKTNFCKVEPPAFAKLYSSLTYIFEEYSHRKDGYKEIIKANLDIFFIELVRNRRGSNAASGNSNAYQQELLERFLDLLEAHIRTHKQVSEYAEMLNVSLYQLNTITRTALGKTPSEIINEHLILESRRHLLATSDQVSQIAYHLGYDDPSYFIRFFRKHTGYSPEAFRSNFR